MQKERLESFIPKNIQVKGDRSAKVILSFDYSDKNFKLKLNQDSSDYLAAEFLFGVK